MFLVLLPDCLLFTCEEATFGNLGENGGAAAESDDVEVDTIGKEETVEKGKCRVLCTGVGGDMEARFSWVGTEDALADEVPDPDSINSSVEGRVVTNEV